MDIDLLAKMVKEVVMDHDVVTLPGVGSFVAEWVPSTFADRGYTIMPPYRRLYFSPKQGEDTLLAALYAKSNDISEADASRILTDFLTEMKEVLKVKKTIVFPGLGRLRATIENHIFFVADEDLDIYPSGFGLQPISLKTHEETKEEVAQAVADIAVLLEEPTPEPAPVEEPAPEPEPEVVIPGEANESPEEGDTPGPKDPGVEEPTPEPAPVTEPTPEPEPEVVIPAEASETLEKKEVHDNIQKKGKGWRLFWRVLLVLAIVVLVLAIGLVVLGNFAPEWLDTILYSPEEYQFLHD